MPGATRLVTLTSAEVLHDRRRRMGVSFTVAATERGEAKPPLLAQPAATTAKRPDAKIAATVCRRCMRSQPVSAEPVTVIGVRLPPAKNGQPAIDVPLSRWSDRVYRPIRSRRSEPTTAAIVKPLSVGRLNVIPSWRAAAIVALGHAERMVGRRTAESTRNVVTIGSAATTPIFTARYSPWSAG